MAFPLSASYSTNESATLPLARSNPILTEVMPFNPVALPSESDLTLLNKLTLSDEDGKTVVVGDLLKDSTVILVAIRHFRCGFCSDFVAYLSSRVTPETLSQANAKLVLIGCGDYVHIKGYRELLIQTPFPVYADPSKKLYTTLGMTRRSLDAGTIVPEYVKGSFFINVVGSIFNALKMGNILSNAGDIKQLGGEFVFKDGKTLYVHRMENTRGHSNVSDILKAAGVKDELA